MQPKLSPNDISSQARGWFVRLLERPSERVRADFLAWKAADPAHEAAYRKVEDSWNAAQQPGERLALREADELAVYLQAMDAAKRQKKLSGRLVGLSVLLAAALGGAFWLQQPHFFQNLAADHVTARGERASFALADGSTVTLDADSALAEDFRVGERRVRLVRGTAFFDVVVSPTPFIVEANDGQVKVLGTAFDVRLLDDGAVVTLQRGRVAVEKAGLAEVVLQPGQQVQYGATGVGAVANVDLNEEMAWRDGRMVFYRRRLADVVEEIARYRPGRIVIASPSLGEELVTGSLSLTDTDAALASLRASVGFSVHSLGGVLTVLRR